jgi:GNAT superfamily N-acetyltransferase
MPLELRPMTTGDTLSYTRIRSITYYGPTHDLLHKGPIRESSIRAAAEDHKKNLSKPNLWHWKIVDTDLEPSSDDPPDNGGRTIAASIWSMHNVKAGEKKDAELAPVPAEKTNETPDFLPPEIRLDALSSLFSPFRPARDEIMGTESQFFMLDSLITHPEHQGRGAARLMLDWGIKKADAEGLVLYLVSSTGGRPVYEKRDFKLVRDIEWDRAAWGGEGIHWNGCMVRQPQGSSEVV